MAASAGVSLLWLPLGAGGSFVRLNGRVYEAVAARLARRPPADLYHAALLVELDGDTWAVEQAPVWNSREPERGVVAEGPVGARWLGRLRLFRYEVRCWRGGAIPDAAEAVGGPLRVETDAPRAARLLGLVPACPTPTWGRDDLRAGAMWNSNSLVAWLLAASGHDVATLAPPPGGRAPGWHAGLVVAARADGPAA
ncbi:MAG: hypothetical protein R3C15_21300 [Thermoleophilia bacterium]